MMLRCLKTVIGTGSATLRIYQVFPILSRLGVTQVQLTNWREFSSNKYKKAKRRRKENDMSWTAELLERKENPPSYPKEPSKLHMVELVQTTRGQPKWDKGYIKQLGFGEEPKLNTRIILKNTENTNIILKKVKHLLRITPITFPYGPPDENCDPDKCYLRDNGEFVVVRDITPKEEIPLLAERDDSVWTMDKETLDKHTRKTVQNYRLNNEYFKEEPVYEMNQDGKEHRYFGNKRMYGQDTWY